MRKVFKMITIVSIIIIIMQWLRFIYITEIDDKKTAIIMVITGVVLFYGAFGVFIYFDSRRRKENKP
jgi:hypothetical protein